MWFYTKQLTKNKSIEISKTYDSSSKNSDMINVNFNRKTDHSGLFIELRLFGSQFEFCLYDGRHWNHKENRYYEEDEEWSTYKKEKTEEELVEDRAYDIWSEIDDIAGCKLDEIFKEPTDKFTDSDLKDIFIKIINEFDYENYKKFKDTPHKPDKYEIY